MILAWSIILYAHGKEQAGRTDMVARIWTGVVRLCYAMPNSNAPYTRPGRAVLRSLMQGACEVRDGRDGDTLHLHLLCTR